MEDFKAIIDNLYAKSAPEGYSPVPDEAHDGPLRRRTYDVHSTVPGASSFGSKTPFAPDAVIEQWGHAQEQHNKNLEKRDEALKKGPSIHDVSSGS